MNSAAAMFFNVTVDSLRLVLGLLTLLTGFAQAQFFNDFDQPPHDYWTAQMNDPMTRLLAEIERGEKVIKEQPGSSLVRRLLKELEIPRGIRVRYFSMKKPIWDGCLKEGLKLPVRIRREDRCFSSSANWMTGRENFLSGTGSVSSAMPGAPRIFFPGYWQGRCSRMAEAGVSSLLILLREMLVLNLNECSIH